MPAGDARPARATAPERVADEVVALCALSRGRALVLTSSTARSTRSPRGVRGRMPYEVLVQGDAPRERLLERFRDEVDSVLVATSTFWQGIDVPGEALSLLVIDKLPFAAPGDPLVEARCERIEALGGDWFREYSLPSAVLQLRQGFGRLIRCHADRGVVAILDPRLRTRAYGRAFLASLPPCPVVDERDAVAEFFGEPWRLIPCGAPVAKKKRDAAAAAPGPGAEARRTEAAATGERRELALRLRGRRGGRADRGRSSSSSAAAADERRESSDKTSPRR